MRNIVVGIATRSYLDLLRYILVGSSLPTDPPMAVDFIAPEVPAVMLPVVELGITVLSQPQLSKYLLEWYANMLITLKQSDTAN